jgi:hypothetical protein
MILKILQAVAAKSRPSLSPFLLSANNQTNGYHPAHLSCAKQVQYIVPFQKRREVQLLDHNAQL